MAFSGCLVSSAKRVSRGAGWPWPGVCQLAVERPTTSFHVAKREVISWRYWTAVSR